MCGTAEDQDACLRWSLPNQYKTPRRLIEIPAVIPMLPAIFPVWVYKIQNAILVVDAKKTVPNTFSP